MQCMPMNMIMVRLYRICQSKFYHLLVNFYYEERNKQDMAFCLQLFNIGMQVGIGEEDLVHVFRLGKRPESGAPIPLMVQLTRYNLKNLIMESLFKLKQSEQKFRQIVMQSSEIVGRVTPKF